MSVCVWMIAGEIPCPPLQPSANPLSIFLDYTVNDINRRRSSTPSRGGRTRSRPPRPRPASHEATRSREASDRAVSMQTCVCMRRRRQARTVCAHVLWKPPSLPFLTYTCT